MALGRFGGVPSIEPFFFGGGGVRPEGLYQPPLPLKVKPRQAMPCLNTVETT